MKLPAVVLLFLWGVVSANEVSVNSLTNGLHITKTDTVDLIDGYWRVVIVMKDHNFGDYLEQERRQIDQLATFVAGHAETIRPIPNSVKEHLLMRVRWLAEIGKNERVKSRHRRGLFNAGGWLLGKMFGIATSGEIESLKNLVQQGFDQTEVLKHDTANIASTVNQMLTEANETRHYLQDHTRAINVLQTAVTQLYKNENNISANLHAVEKTVLLTDLVTTMERRHQIKREHGQFEREQRMHLESGRLTESIMPRATLEGVRTEMENAGHSPAPLEWYYEHCLVRPLWETEDGMSYIVELPMTRDRVTGYHLQTFPHQDPMGNWLRLLLHRFIGYDEQDGTMVLLKACKGNRPTICEKDLTYHSGLPCERGLILGTPRGLSRCNVRFEEPAETNSVAVGINSHIVTTPDKSLESRCLGEATRYHQVKPGSFAVKFASSNCQLQGSGGWVLESVDVHEERINLPDTTLNMSAVSMPEMPELHLIKPDSMIKLNLVKGIEIGKIALEPTMPRLLVPSHPTYNSYVIIAMLAGLVVIGLAVAAYMLRRYGLARCLKRCRSCRKPQRDTAAEERPSCPESTMKEYAPDREGKQSEEAYEMQEMKDIAARNASLVKLQRQFVSPTNPLLPAHHGVTCDVPSTPPDAGRLLTQQYGI